MNIDELLIAASDGDQEAFAHLYDRMVDPVRVLVQGFLTEPARVDTVTELVMLEVWRTAPAFDPAKTSASRWILAMARRLAIENNQASRTVRNREVRVAKRISEASSPPASIGARAETERFLKVLSSLPATHRHSLQLAYHGRATYREVAALLGASPELVIDWMRSGLRELQDAIRRPIG